MARLLEGEWEIETEAGYIYDLAWPTGGVTRLTGIGLPPISYAAQRTPTQHGSAHLGYRLEDREILLGLAWSPNTTLIARRAGRPYQALNYLAGPLILRRTMPDHTVRELRQLWNGGGMELDTEQAFETVEYSSVRLICRDPAWYDPASHSQLLDYSDLTQYYLYSEYTTIYPVTNGDWYTYPTIVLTGPMTYFNLQSVTSGQQLRYFATIAVGEVVTLVCNPEPTSLSATSTVNGDVERYIYPNDDFGGFALWPAREVTGGINEWFIYAEGMTAASSIRITWEDRYQGG